MADRTPFVPKKNIRQDMILIADSGSTKTDWCVVREGRSVRRFETDGTNPFFQAPEQIERTLVSQLLPRLDGRPVRSVFFYGAGCAFEEQTAMIRRVLRSLLDVRRVEVGSDMLAAGAIRGSPAFWVRGPIRAAGTGSGSPSRCRRSDSFSATRGAGPCWAAGWSATA